MTSFIFSADAHVVEPKGLYQDRLPERLRDRALQTERTGQHLLLKGDGRVLQKMMLADGNSGMGDQNEAHKRSGGSNIELRLQDMDRDGIDAEIIFPTLALMMWQCSRELMLETARVYNDWCIAHFKGHLHRFVPTAAIPTAEPAEAAAEFRRIAALGYRSAMIPLVTAEGVPTYNSADWDVLWQAAHDTRIPINLHAGTGAPPVSIRGPGAAIMNYARLQFQAMDAVSMMISGGALDRFPGLQFVTVECGASWLVGLGERLDEVHAAHQFYVQPKLSMKPSGFLYRQVKCSFQHDKACIRNRHITGVAPLLWASDYPHLEGTFPHSKQVIAGLFEGEAVPQHEQDAILGGNAAALYRLPKAA
ncbi:MAG TPA: amidohydrolase family protein [Nevskiaceae bacterium]|nr:amidohydrolase family protein [Nevskiaceae bacterium]